MNEEPAKKSLAGREEEILKFWKEHQVFKKSLEKKSPRGEFVFYDGPPFATGLPHYGHILAGTIKDVIPRFKTMRGFYVPRRWGWDCHGLPVENEVEKELGFKIKKDIENFGIEQFNAKAKEAVMRYSDDWRRIIPRMGRWVDMENDYRTMDSSYTESVWWVFKTLYAKGLIYEGWKSMHLCPRCETTLSNFEVTQGYKDINDLSVYVKFKLLTSNFQLETSGDVYAVAWTTTPWTLPGNAALALHPEHDYAFVEITASNAPEIQTGDVYIVGAREEILKRVFGNESFQFDPVSRVGTFVWNGAQVAFSAKKGMKGRDLIGQPYQPLFDFYSRSSPTNPYASETRHSPEDMGERERGGLDKGWKIYAGKFVTEEDGTGIVHVAPAFGEDDYQLSVKEKLPFIQHVAADGTFRKEVTGFAGLSAKPKGNPRETDEKIADALEAAGKLLKREPYTHEYPHCWRCETPLLNYAAPSWFVKVSALREKLVEENKKIHWVPSDVGEYRFGNWLADAKDWAISRSRYFGAPLPVWRCVRCGAVRVIGSMDEARRWSSERILKLTLLRHGEGEQNVAGVLDDLPGAYPLTRRGRQEVERAARRIEKEGLFRPFGSDGRASSYGGDALGGVDAIISSPILRAKETAQIIGSYLGKPVSVDERLREVDSGEWDEKKADDPTTEAARAAYEALPPGARYRAKRGGTGESFEDVEHRMSEAFLALLAKHKGESVLFVSHESPLVYLLRALGTLTLEEAASYFRKERFASFAEPITVYIDTETGKEFDMHRPQIDRLLLRCDECVRTTGSGADLMRRVPEVFDCWFESGSMPYGQAHYPFEHDGAFEPLGGWFRSSRGFPADFIAEGLDQTRGWFYSLLVVGVGLFDRSPYKNVIVNGIILAENGEKMSKRLKNYPDPLAVVARYGADALRYYLLSSQVVRGEELRFSEKGVDEVAKKVFNRLDNVLQFYLLYADKTDLRFKIKDLSNALDAWIHARLNQLIAEVTTALENYELDKATRPLGDFIDDLSTWYVRRSRTRIKSQIPISKSQTNSKFQSPNLAADTHAARSTLHFILRELAKLMAPFTPFFAEYLFQTVQHPSSPPPLLRGEEGWGGSIHLEDWPSAGKVDENALKEMQEVRKIVSLGLEARAKANIKVRQPLSRLKIKDLRFKLNHELRELIEDEVNVKEVVVDETLQAEVELDTALTPELKDEGQFRELVRFVQEMRKRGGFTAGEFAVLSVGATGASRRFVEQHEQELSRIAALKNIVIQDSIAGGEPFQADEILLTLMLGRTQ